MDKLVKKDHIPFTSAQHLLYQRLVPAVDQQMNIAAQLHMLRQNEGARSSCQGSRLIELALTNVGFRNYIAAFKEHSFTDKMMDFILDDDDTECLQKQFDQIVPSLDHKLRIISKFMNITPRI